MELCYERKFSEREEMERVKKNKSEHNPIWDEKENRKRERER